MNPGDIHLSNVLSNHRSESSMLVAKAVINNLRGSITVWANGHLLSIDPAGSIAKGTAISETSDVDILVSVRETATETLKEVYETLFNRLTTDGYAPTKQNVSLGITLSGWKIDIVPAKRQSWSTTNHTIWSHKKQTHRETDISKHIQYVTDSGRLDEIRLTKIWKKVNRLEFPSFPLEVTVINALRGCSTTATADNFLKVLQYIQDSITTVRIVDPTKQSNILSDELNEGEKIKLADTARCALSKQWWEEIIS